MKLCENVDNFLTGGCIVKDVGSAVGELREEGRIRDELSDGIAKVRKGANVSSQ